MLPARSGIISSSAITCCSGCCGPSPRRETGKLKAIGSTVAAFLRLSVQKVRQVAAAAFLLASAFRRGRRRRGCSSVSGQAQRLEPFGLGAQRRGAGFIFGCRLFSVVSTL